MVEFKLGEGLKRSTVLIDLNREDTRRRLWSPQPTPREGLGPVMIGTLGFKRSSAGGVWTGGEHVRESEERGNTVTGCANMGLSGPGRSLWR